MCTKKRWTIDKKYGEYAPIPLNIVCAVIHYLLFLYKNEFLKKNLVKYFPKRTKLHHFKFFSRGACPRTPYQTRGFAMQIPPLFLKNILNPIEMKS